MLFASLFHALVIRPSSSLTSSKYMFHISESFFESSWAEFASGNWAVLSIGGTWFQSAVGISIVMQGPAASPTIRHVPTHHQHRVGLWARNSPAAPREWKYVRYLPSVTSGSPTTPALNSLDSDTPALTPTIPQRLRLWSGSEAVHPA
jgi:hypothetical protein